MLTKCGLGEAGKRSVFVDCAARGRTRPPNGKGSLYLGFHLDPLDRVHWNNEVDPVAFSIQAPEGVTVTPARGAAIDPEEPADADPREFLVEVDGPPGAVLDLTVR